MRDLGKLGEKQFEKWAGEVGVVTNPSIEDKKGWDFFVELPDYLQDDYHLTNYPHPIKSFVQVKSTDSRKKNLSIKLSNWRQLVQNDNPTFIIVFEFLGENSPKNVYLIHVWEKIIKRYFERLRELDISDNLNKKSMSVSYGDEELINPCESLSLFKSIVQHVHPNYQKYSINKTDLINEYGYEDLDFSLRMEFDLPEKYDDLEEYLVDFALGIVDRIEFNELKIDDDAIAKKKIWNDLDFVSITRESIGKCQYRLRTEDYSEEILLELETYLPSGVSHLVSKDKLKVLLRGDFFYITSHLHNPESSFKFQFEDTSKSFSLSKTEQVCRLIDFLKKVESQEQDLWSEFIIGEKYEGSGKVELLSSIDSDLLALFEPIKHALSISEYFGIKNKIEVSIEELMNSKGVLEFINSIVNEEEKLFKLEGMWSEEEFSEEISTATPISIIIKLGEYYLYLGAIIIGKPEKERIEEGKIYYSTETTNIQILRKSVRKKEFPDRIKNDLKKQIIGYVENIDGLILVKLPNE